MSIRDKLFLFCLNFFCTFSKSTNSQNDFNRIVITRPRFESSSRTLSKDSSTDCKSEETEFCGKNSQYRSYNGRCNNLDNPFFGAKDTPQPRLWPSVYDDNFSLSRSRSKTGSKLPSAREVSQSIHTDETNINDFSLMLMQWG